MKSGVSFLQIHILITPIFIGFRSGENFDSISCKKIRKARTHRIKEWRTTPVGFVKSGKSPHKSPSSH